MSSSYGESMGAPSQNPSYSGSTSEAGNFECNICFDLAQDPIVTLCGHLFCWPCLYKWLHFHSQSHECPVCKAFIQEDRLVPLYGRGKTSSDPRSRSVPGVDIPNRPTGQRPETAPPPPPPPENNNHFPQHGLGFMGGSGWGGFPPMPATRPGNYALSASWGGLLPQLFNFQMHGFPSTTMYGGGTGYPYGYAHHYHGAHPHAYPHRPNQRQQDNYLKLLFIVIGTLVLLTLISA